jgi:hypothetical protein
MQLDSTGLFVQVVLLALKSSDGIGVSGYSRQGNATPDWQADHIETKSTADLKRKIPITSPYVR